jgi:hypothetical protein
MSKYVFGVEIGKFEDILLVSLISLGIFLGDILLRHV